MKLTREQSQKLLQERGIWITNACDKCGQLLGAVRWTRRGEPGEWCSEACRDRIKADEPAIDESAARCVAFLSGVASVILSLMSLKAARSANQISEKSLSEAKTARDLAAESLRQAKDVAERELADWRQSKWLELYFRASEMCDTLEHFQKMHKPQTGEYRYSEPIASDYNNFIFLNRKCLTMLAVRRYYMTIGFNESDEARFEVSMQYRVLVVLPPKSAFRSSPGDTNPSRAVQKNRER